MKLKNVKVGQRVEHKGGGSDPQRKGKQGTIMESGSAIPFVQWDDSTENVTYYRGVAVGVEIINYLRKVK